VTGLNTKDLYADITAGPNANELVQIDPKTGAVTPVVTGLDNPHGLAFVPSSPKALVAGDPPTSSLGTNNALTTTGVQNTNENTTDGTPTTSTTHNGISSTADTFVFPPNLGEHNNVVTVTDQIQPLTLICLLSPSCSQQYQWTFITMDRI
jgi:hypothetical protein